MPHVFSQSAQHRQSEIAPCAGLKTRVFRAMQKSLCLTFSLPLLTLSVLGHAQDANQFLQTGKNLSASQASIKNSSSEAVRANPSADDHNDFSENSLGQQFIALTFHDVRDDVKRSGDRDLYAVSTQNLAAFFEWINQNQWTPISLKNIQDAKQGKYKLPAKAVLLCFDDGALSSYNRVFPLLKLYKYHAVFAIPTSWINGNTKAGYAAYGDGNLMSWDQMRVMQATGLVDFASHSDDLHKGIISNPQLNERAAAIHPQYFPKLKRYESDAEYRTRVFKDLKHSKQVLDRELGQKTTAIIWPYGAVNGTAQDLAQQAGFTQSFSLGRSAISNVHDQTYQRVLIFDNPMPEEIHQQVQNIERGGDNVIMQQARMLSFPMQQLQAGTLAQSDAKLGELLNAMSALGNSHLSLDAMADQNAEGIFETAYFPTQWVSTQYDLLSRVAWQAKTRVGQNVWVNLPVYPDPKQPNLVVNLSQDIAKHSPYLAGISLDAKKQLACLWNSPSDQRPECQKTLKQIQHLLDQIRVQNRPYESLSEQFLIALRVDLVETDAQALKNHFQKFLQGDHLLIIDVDGLRSPTAFSALVQQIQTLSESQKQRVMINLILPNTLNPEQAKSMNQAFAQLKKLGIRKLGVSPYTLSQSSAIHQYLYPSLSLNSSPVTYKTRQE